MVHPPLPGESGTSLASINTFLFPPLPHEMKPNLSSASWEGIIGTAIIFSLEKIQELPFCLEISTRINKNTLE